MVRWNCCSENRRQNVKVEAMREMGLFALGLAAISGAQQFDISKTANAAVFMKAVPLAAEHKAMLAKNQFVVSPAPGVIEMQYVFDENDYMNLPSIVTIDVPMHLYHILFDATLRTVEANALY